MHNKITSLATNFLPLTPNPPVNFEGRNTEIAVLAAMLKTDQRVVVVLHGMGGIGKTAIAIKLANDLQSHFLGGVFWCSLPDNQGNVQSILRHWGHACGQDLSDDIEPIELSTQIRRLLKERRNSLGPTLFIVDDVRSKWQEALEKLMDVCPSNSAILITLRNERLVPTEAYVYHLEAPPKDEALRLLKRYGGDRVHEIIEANYQDAQALLAEVGSLPLAIELLGGYLKRISRKPGFQLHNVLLKLGSFADIDVQLPEYAGLFAVFTSSYQGLTKEAKRIFRWLGAFAEGSLNLDHIAAVVGSSKPSIEAILDNELVPISFLGWGTVLNEYKIHPITYQYVKLLLAGKIITQEEESQRVSIQELPLMHQLMDRYFNDDDIRQFCFELSIEYENLIGQTKRAKIRALLDEMIHNDQLPELVAILRRERPHVEWPGYKHKEDEEAASNDSLPEHLAAQKSHLAFYVSLAESNARQEVSAWDNLEANLGNILLAAERAAGFQDVSALLTLEEALIHTSHFFEVRTYYEEAIDLLTTSLEVQQKQAAQEYQARTLNKLAYFQLQQGNTSTANQVALEALEMANSRGDLEQEADSSRYLGFSAYMLGETKDALAHFDHELQLRRQLGGRQRLASGLQNLGALQLKLGLFRKAKDLLAEAILAYGNDLHGTALCFSNRGLVSLYLGDYALAKKDFELALEQCRQLSDRPGIVQNLLNLGLLRCIIADYSESLQNLKAALTFADETDDTTGKVMALSTIAEVYSIVGLKELARNYLQEAALLRGQEDELDEELYFLGASGSVLQGLGEFKESLAAYSEQSAVAEKSQLKYFQVQGLLGQTSVLLTHSIRLQLELARELAEKAIQLCEEYHLKGFAPRAYASLAYTELKLGHTDHGLIHMQHALSLLNRQKHIHGPLPELYIYALHVLEANNRMAEYGERLSEAYCFLRETAEAISDFDMQQAYLSLSLNKEIAAKWEYHQTRRRIES